jgi:hypothetical protein
VARRLALRTEPRQAAAHRVVAPIQTLAASQTASRKPSNGCPEVVSASNPVRALGSIALRLRFADCAPPKDFHLCATTSANSRFRQPVSCSDRTWAVRFIPKEGRRTTLSLPDRPPHSRVRMPATSRSVSSRARRRDACRARSSTYGLGATLERAGSPQTLPWRAGARPRGTSAAARTSATMP